MADYTALKIVILLLIFIGGLPAVCLSLLRCSNALEAVFVGKRGARWRLAGWYLAVLCSAGASSLALTYALDIYFHHARAYP